MQFNFDGKLRHQAIISIIYSSAKNRYNHKYQRDLKLISVTEKKHTKYILRCGAPIIANELRFLKSEITDDILLRLKKIGIQLNTIELIFL